MCMYDAFAEIKIKVESLTRHETSSTVCLRLSSDGSSICYSTVTLNFDLLNLMHSSLSHNTSAAVSLVKILLIFVKTLC